MCINIVLLTEKRIDLISFKHGGFKNRCYGKYEEYYGIGIIKIYQEPSEINEVLKVVIMTKKFI